MKQNATVEIVKVTPETASEWLAERWDGQRSVRFSHVEKLASDMEAGRFKLSSDAILRIKGKLANGQHRMEAVVRCGRAQMFLVMESSDEDLYKVLDAGIKRTVSDGLNGVLFSKSIPSIARWVKCYESSRVKHYANSGDESTDPGKRSSQVELIDYCISNQSSLSEAASFVNPLYNQTGLLPLSIGGALYAIAASSGCLEKAKLFLSAVYVDGGNSAAGDLRNRLISNRGSKAKLNNGYVFGITIKSFKNFCNNTRAGVIKWNTGEELPKI